MENNMDQGADFNSGNSMFNQETPTTPPKNYLVESILITILCCLPLGIAGIINATKVEGLFASGDYTGAQHAADEAKKWCKFGLIGGIVVIVIYVIFIIISAAAGNAF